MTRMRFISPLLAIGLLAGCTTPAGNYGTGGGSGGGATATNVTIFFDNKADQPVDPHFYRSSSNATAGDLFGNPANRYQNFNGQTTIAAKTKVTVSLPAEQVETIGTSQAAFGSFSDLLNGGKSVESPIFHQSVDFSASQEVTFTFSRDSGGAYHTTLGVTGP